MAAHIQKGSLHLHTTHQNKSHSAKDVVKNTVNNRNNAQQKFPGKVIPANNANQTAKQKNKVVAKVSKKQAGAVVNSAHTITDNTDLNNTGIILLEDKVIEALRIQSGPLAPSCEYQVHYWALVIRAQHKEDKSLIDVCIPTVLFNYKQLVTGGTIDFELTDVEKVSIDSEPVHDQVIYPQLHSSGIIDQITALFPEDLFDIRLLKTNFNSIHKHPGSPSHQSFSGTDLNKSTVHDTGIVYPLSEATIDNQPNFAGIMAHEYRNEHNKVAHFEYRVVNGKIDKTQAKSNITYTQGRCHAYIKKSELKSSSGANDFLGFASESKAYDASKNINPSTNNKDFFDALHSLWDDCSFKPFTELVQPENIKNAYQANKKKTSKVQHYSANDLYGDPYENDDWWNDYHPKSYGHTANKTTPANKNHSAPSTTITGGQNSITGSGASSKNQEKSLEDEYQEQQRTEAEYIAKAKKMKFLSDEEVDKATIIEMRQDFRIVKDFYMMRYTPQFEINVLSLPQIREKYKNIKKSILEEIEDYDSIHPEPQEQFAEDTQETKEVSTDENLMGFKRADFNQYGNFINYDNLAKVQKALVQAGFTYIEFTNLSDEEKVLKLKAFVDKHEQEDKPEGEQKNEQENEAADERQEDQLSSSPVCFNQENIEYEDCLKIYNNLMSGDSKPSNLEQVEIDSIYTYLLIESEPINQISALSDEDLVQRFLDVVHKTDDEQ